MKTGTFYQKVDNSFIQNLNKVKKLNSFIFREEKSKILFTKQIDDPFNYFLQKKNSKQDKNLSTMDVFQKPNNNKLNDLKEWFNDAKIDFSKNDLWN